MSTTIVPKRSASEIYRAYNEAENRHDLEATTHLLAADLHVTVNGRPALAAAQDDHAAMTHLLGLYPDFHRDLDEVIAVGSERAVVRWRMQGTSTDAQRPALDAPGCSIVRSKDGRLTEAILYYDSKVLDDALDSAGR